MTFFADPRPVQLVAQVLARNVASTMRWTAFIVGSIVLVTTSVAQKVKFEPVDKAEILQRFDDMPASDAERAIRIKVLFSQAGCGAFIKEQPVKGAATPNIICELRGEGRETVIVGAHYDHTSSAERPLDNWSGAALLPALYQSLHGRRRHHNFVFVAFADQGNELAGAQSFAGHMTAVELQRTEAMVNLDVLGLSPTKVWTSHSDKELFQDLMVMSYALKLPASQIDMERAGNTDSDAFAGRQIPNITIHSLTEVNLAQGTATPLRPGNYYDTYRLLCGYLAFLDATLKPRPHPE